MHATTDVHNGLVFLSIFKKTLQKVLEEWKVREGAKKCQNDFALQLLPFSFSLNEFPDTWSR